MKPSDVRIEVRPAPLSDSRWQAIEGRVYERIDARPLLRATPSRRPLWIAVAAMLLLATGAAFGARHFSHDKSIVVPPIDRGTSRMTIGDTTLDLSPGAVVRVQPDEVSLQEGSVDCAVRSQMEPRSFVVTTPHAHVEAESGSFRVDVDQTKTDVLVKAGTVRAGRSSEPSIIVNAGQPWSSFSSPQVIAPPPHTTATEATTVAAYSPPTTPNVSPREQFELAESLERTTPERAIALYADLARKTGSWADNALFAEARLESERGRHDSAKHLLNAYLTRCPNGPNAEDARALLKQQPQ